ncbi:hypothetical protein AVEN_225517-1 [Araneus ventricosus]|uniref:Uncharacterized protein n=1 Tax=Araneus ventricosus TaxID=182803 RepID=A0A4Y2FRB5_ARAVE|nr:hypothetical protein AVEN_225517-1 [Araneus ventricosus]
MPQLGNLREDGSSIFRVWCESILQSTRISAQANQIPEFFRIPCYLEPFLVRHDNALTCYVRHTLHQGCGLFKAKFWKIGLFSKPLEFSFGPKLIFGVFWLYFYL